MSIEGVLMILLWIVVVFAIGWLAHWIITTYFPEPVRTPALLVVGIVLLVLVILLLIRMLPSGGRIGALDPSTYRVALEEQWKRNTILDKS